MSSSTQAVRVVSLQASNIMRLSAVEFSWKDGQRVLTLGGKNGAGKSSVLNAVAMALGGAALCPDEPLKRGQQRGYVELNLDSLIVRREFWRDLLTEQPAEGPPAYGETKSRLVVKNKEGVKQEPAQRLLDKLIGKLTFDPTAFAFEDEKKQTEILRRIVDLDFTAHDEQRSIAYDRRGVFNRQHKEQMVILDSMAHYDDVPAEEVSLQELMAALKNVEEKRKAWASADKTATDGRILLAQNAESRDRLQLKVVEIKDQIARLNAVLVEAEEAATTAAARYEANIHLMVANAAQLQKEIPETGPIEFKIHEAEEINSKIRANAARKACMDTVVRFQAQAEEQDALIHRLDDERAKKIRDTKFPVEGLGIAHNGVVTFNNIGLKQASTAEQIRVSVAIGFALNPGLRLLCIKNGNALDDDSFKLIADAAEAAGGQVLMEIVTKDANDVSVFIEDGHN